VSPVAEWWYAVPYNGQGANIYVQGAQYSVGTDFTQGGTTYTPIGGPYSSKAAAEKAVAGYVNTSGPANFEPGSQLAPETIQAASAPFDSVEQALTAFYNQLTNKYMWRSLGWLVLGIVLMFIGIGLIAEPAVKGVVSAIPPVPV
jgi:hypothetical protein